MTTTTRLGLWLLPAALGIGLLGDALLRATPWGLNWLLWIAALIAMLWFLARRLESGPVGEGRWLVIPALLLAAGLAWRDSAWLRGADIAGLLCCLGVGAARTRAGSVRVAEVSGYLGDVLRGGFLTLFGVFPLLFRDIAWNTVPRTGWLPRVLAVGRGLILVLPLLLLFGGLLMSADAVYQHLVNQALHFDIGVLLGHLFLTVFLACLTAGCGRVLLWADRPPAGVDAKPRVMPSLGVLETGTILGLLNLLFGSFVLVQIRYLFGGASLVLATAGMTYKDYARSGFFELVWVAALILPILLALHWLQNPGDTRAQRLFTGQAGVQVGLLFVIMASAVMRMRLYQEACGLTELRLYTMAFMGWLAVVFAWFSVTVLRGRREHFAFGAFVSGFCLLMALHCVNPDALIVRANLASALHGRPFDTDYAATLGADAVPTLTAGLPSLPLAAQEVLAPALLSQWSVNSDDWRSWNWDRAAAFHAVHSQRGRLLAALPPPAPVPIPAQTTAPKTTTTLVIRKAHS